MFSAYGDARGARPAITADASGTAAIQLADMSDVVVQDLSLSNPVGPTTAQRQGILVTASTGVVRDVLVQRLWVHNVVATTRNQANGSGGIIFTARGSHFEGVTIQDNTVTDSANAGISVLGGGTARPAADQPWPDASTKVLVTRNVVTRVQGNGIVVFGSEAPVSSWNKVSYAAMANRDYLDFTNRVCNVGLWFFDSNNGLAEHNEVSHTVFKGANAVTNGCDGEAFDIDWNQDGTVFQYNYSHDNEGSFVLICATTSPHRGAIRYNLSVNDGSVYAVAPCENALDPAKYNADGISIYNNTFVSPAPRFAVEDDQEVAKQVIPFLGTLDFRNNILYATAPVPADNYFACGTNCSNNLFYGMPTYGAAALQADPQFVAPNVRGTGMAVPRAFSLRPKSPAACAGAALAPVTVPASAARTDFFGHRVQNPPSVGFAESQCRPSGGGQPQK
ncbi:right-handed parallel beta-helix repeat-containing protein [Frankia sp. AgB1.9]|uniref:right-handed parallel beta-helix repeat-containing protein n=1 Tax=Frankia sp. AgB1.9 TaxID=1836968 RepID=UPI001931BE9B|nr:right-handed parallel beta-helix repeat-containing protein [Frankia sp. AgB1.9]MBL7493299.1 right-handed parallel beta-helix repeat-containing protein [Frankia sp. AgW1.1]MBL7549578.1 right-handed parallel beta-helix repeat-containing protein [Frankia sp. AgB1.9]